MKFITSFILIYSVSVNYSRNNACLLSLNACYANQYCNYFDKNNFKSNSTILSNYNVSLYLIKKKNTRTYVQYFFDLLVNANPFTSLPPSPAALSIKRSPRPPPALDTQTLPLRAAAKRPGGH